jgi:hypothetical protein
MLLPLRVRVHGAPPCVFPEQVVSFNHRNRSRRRIHLRMQDNQMGLKFMGLAPADMARLPHSPNKRPCSSAGTTPTLQGCQIFHSA